MKRSRLQDWEKQAIADAYVAGEKVESIASEFGIIRQYVHVLVRKMGAKVRLPWRPRKRNTNLKPQYRVRSCPLRRVSLNGWRIVIPVREVSVITSLV